MITRSHLQSDTGINGSDAFVDKPLYFGKTQTACTNVRVMNAERTKVRCISNGRIDCRSTTQLQDGVRTKADA